MLKATLYGFVLMGVVSLWCIQMKTKLFSITLNDCRVDTFRVSGHGGQKVNKTESGV